MFISVVMAVYNGERYLNEAVQSILNQTYPHFELIIVNDGSTDRTKEILDSLNNPRVNVIHGNKNRGAAACLNSGIEQAKGEWIAIHDSDDISEPTRLADQAGYLASRPKAIGAGSLIKGIPGTIDNTNMNRMLSEENYYNLIYRRRDIYDFRLFSCYLCHGSVIFSKEAFYKAGGYDEAYKICYDYDLWLRLFDIRPIKKVPKVLYHYRIYRDSLGKKDGNKTKTELMTSSFSYICKKLRGKENKEPNIALIGSRRGCDFFKENVGRRFKSVSYITDPKEEDLIKSLNRFQAGRIQAFAVLNDRYANHAIRFFTKNKVLWNEQLFKIWNYKF